MTTAEDCDTMASQSVFFEQNCYWCNVKVEIWKSYAFPVSWLTRTVQFIRLVSAVKDAITPHALLVTSAAVGAETRGRAARWCLSGDSSWTTWRLTDTNAHTHTYTRMGACPPFSKSRRCFQHFLLQNAHHVLLFLLFLVVAEAKQAYAPKTLPFRAHACEIKSQIESHHSILSPIALTWFGLKDIILAKCCASVRFLHSKSRLFWGALR